MAEITKEALLTLTVDGQKAAETLAAYKEQVAAAKAKLDELKSSETATSAEIAAQEQVVKATTKEMKSYEYQVQKTIQQNTNKQGSLKALRGELSTLTAQYDSLSAAERKGAAGQDLEKKIARVYKEITKAENATGRFQRNVGNYGMQMIDVFGKAGGAAGGMIAPIKGATMSLKTMSATPAIAVLGMLAQLVNKVAEAFKGSEAAMNAVNVAFAPFKTGGIAVKKIFEGLADALARTATWLTNIADKLGLVSEAMKENQQLTKDEIRLKQMQREAEVANAKDQLEFSRLRVEAEDKVKYSAKQRLDMLTEADQRERAISERKLAIAQLEYDIAKRRAAQSANDAEANDNLARSEANLYNVQREYYDAIRRLKMKVTAVNKEMTASVKELAKSEKEQLELLEKQYQKQIELQAKEIETRLKIVANGSYEELEAQQEKLRIEYERDMHAYQQQENTEQLRMERAVQFQYDMAALQQQYWDAQDAAIAKEIDTIIAELNRKDEASKKSRKKTEDDAKAEAKARLAAASAIGGAIGSVGDLMGELGEENEQLVKASKVLALAEIAIQTGVATAEGISAAMRATNWIEALAATASVIAAITAGMSSAVASVKSAKFAKGGLVVGEGTSTSDSINARLSNGESVINAQATSMFAPLLSAINQIGGGNAIAAPSGSDGTAILEQAIARGMQEAQLSVSVKEIDSVKDKVTRIKSIANV